MHLYLMQHGLSLSKEEDPQKPLSEQGREETARVAKATAWAGVEVEEIWHSTKLRAKQTAEIVAEHLSPSVGIVQLQGLAPMDDPVPIAATLAQQEKTVLVVSHLPFLERLADLLLTPRGGEGVVRFSYSALVGLERTPGGFRVALLVPPMFAPARGSAGGDPWDVSSGTS
jgi:phosphohistidine phosphatase